MVCQQDLRRDNFIRLGNVFFWIRKLSKNQGPWYLDSDETSSRRRKLMFPRAGLVIRQAWRSIFILIFRIKPFWILVWVRRFTDYSLRHGAKKVFAVDGTDQSSKFETELKLFLFTKRRIFVIFIQMKHKLDIIVWCVVYISEGNFAARGKKFDEHGYDIDCYGKTSIWSGA